MKKFLFIIILITLFFTQTFSQIDTTSLSFYPLNNGDYWEYVEVTEDYWFPFITTYDYYSHQVIGDTLFSVGKNFKVIERKQLGSTQNPQYLYERIDTVSCNVFGYDYFTQIGYLVDSLKSQSGDSCKAKRSGYYGNDWVTICTNIGTDSVLGMETISKNFIEQEPLSPINYKLTKGFGLTYLNFGFDFGQFTRHLLYAVIDSVEYGTQVNSIPNENNPIVIKLQLHQNYPNPFNSTTIIPFEAPQKSKVEIIVYDINGRKINTLLSTEMNQGSHSVSWDGTNQSGESVASGVYIYLLKVISSNKSFIMSNKLLLLR